MIEYYYGDQLRWAFGMENPNHAAALIASLLPLVWALKYAWSPENRWVREAWRGLHLIVFAGVWFLLAMTFSRGGLVAALAGFAFVAWRWFPVWRAHWIRAGLVCVVVFGVVVAPGAASRSVEGIVEGDASSANRLIVWCGGLEMLAVAPGGVGRGNSGAFFMNWLQPTDMDAGYRTLVNSYLTFFAEFGLWVGGGVVFLVALFLLLCRPLDDLRRSGHPEFRGALRTACYASLITFAIAGFFSTTMETPWVWIAPGIACLGLFLLTLWNGRAGWPRRSLLVPYAVAAGCVTGMAFWLVGTILHSSNPVQVVFDDERVSLRPRSGMDGGSDKEILVLTDESVLGETPGKLLRTLAERHEVDVHWTPDGGVAADCPFVLVAGDRIREPGVSAVGRRVFLAPPVVSAEKARQLTGGREQSTLIVVPGFDQDGRSGFWRSVESAADGNVELMVAAGHGIQLESAWDELMGPIGDFFVAGDSVPGGR